MPCLRSINAIQVSPTTRRRRDLYMRVAVALGMKSHPMQRSVVSQGSHRNSMLFLKVSSKLRADCSGMSGNTILRQTSFTTNGAAGDAEIIQVRAEQGGAHPLLVIATRSTPGKWLAARLREDSQLPLDPTEPGSVLVMILRRQRVSLRNTDLMAASSAPVDTCVGCLNTGIEQNVICRKIFLLKELLVFVLSHFRTFFSLEKQQSLERGPLVCERIVVRPKVMR